MDNVRKRVLSARSAEFPVPAQKEAPTRVPALRGPERLMTMLRVAVVFGAVAVFALGIAAVKYLHEDVTPDPSFPRLRRRTRREK